MSLKNFVQNLIQATRNFLNELFGSSTRTSIPSRKNIPSTRELLKNLETDKNKPAKKISPVEEKEIIVEIRNLEDWNKYKSQLQKIDKLKNFAAAQGENLKWFKIYKFENDLNNFQMSEFDNYTTEKVVNETVRMIQRFMNALDSCNREINNPLKNSAVSQELKNLIEEYLKGIGVKSMNFKPGDNYDVWADLGMDGETITEKTFDRSKQNTLKEIYVQPHFLVFIDEHGEKEKRIFGGSCAVYVFEE